MAKKKLPNVDGLGPKDIKRIRSALREVWRWSYARRLVEQRCVGPDGFPRCEQCRKRTPRVAIDHIKPCGEVDEGYIQRLFVASIGLQGLCTVCHKAKTSAERKARRKEAKGDVGDFF